jgi:hypothetical protein
MGTRKGAWIEPALSIALLVFGLLVLTGILISLIRLAGVGYPNVGFGEALNGDAAALSIGQPLYQDPAQGFTGMPYTPLLAGVVSVLDRLVLWPGWPPAMTILASLGMVGLVGRAAYGPRSASTLDRAFALAEAIGVGALAWLLVSCLQFNGLYDGRTDGPAWALALFGLVLLPSGVGGARLQLVLALVLLSAGFWTKQTAIAASIAAVLWLALAARTRAAWRRQAILFPTALLIVNLAILVALNLLTAGWQFYFNFELPLDQPTGDISSSLVGHVLGFGREFVNATTLPVAFAVILWIALARGSRASGSRRAFNRAALTKPNLLPHGRRSLPGSTDDVYLVTLLATFVIVGFATAGYFRSKLGTDENLYIGVVWATALLGGLAYRLIRTARPRSVAPAVTVLAFFLTAAFHGSLNLPVYGPVSLPREGLIPASSWSEVPAAVRAYAATHLVYHPAWSTLNVRSKHSIYPNYDNFSGLLAAGRQPRYLVDALLMRRFDGVFRFDAAPSKERFSSGAGVWEENYLWKLNRVISAKYRDATGGPRGLLERRPGGDPAAWMRRCFGPFRLAGAAFRINRGGGFWCRPNRADHSLALVDTPARYSELRTERPIKTARGRLTATLGARRATFAVSFQLGDGGDLTLKGVGSTRGTGGVVLWAFRDDSLVGRLRVRSRTGDGAGAPVKLELHSAPDSFSIRPAPEGRVEVQVPEFRSGAVLRLGASKGSRARFDLAGLRLAQSATEVP